MSWNICSLPYILSSATSFMWTMCSIWTQTHLSIVLGFGGLLQVRSTKFCKTRYILFRSMWAHHLDICICLLSFTFYKLTISYQRTCVSQYSYFTYRPIYCHIYFFLYFKALERLNNVHQNHGTDTLIACLLFVNDDRVRDFFHLPFYTSK